MDGKQIIGGVASDGTEEFAPHVVALYDTEVGGLCTASILSDSILVTAAHCVENDASKIAVLFGRDLNARQFEVRRVLAHRVSPLWPYRQNQFQNNGDIAVVRFTGGLPAGYAPIQMLENSKLLIENSNLLLAGFGAAKVVIGTDPLTGKPVSDHIESGTLRFVTTTLKSITFSVSELVIENSKGKGACHGDSGGPAYSVINGKLTLVGVTSRGMNDPMDRCNGDAVYTSVAYYAKWIAQTANQLNLLPAPAAPVAPAGTVAGTAKP